MKDTGIVRFIDKFGRLVVTKEILRQINITPETPVEIYRDKDKIVLKKYDIDEYIMDRIKSLDKEIEEIRHDLTLDDIITISNALNDLTNKTMRLSVR